ncbi:DUF7130 family rubredoxin-like protein [Natrinema longum]|uniref:DUF7130 domain-containing protein n=1 Tax=Natrinema longum TaxID=370324 RepID=A0A8A2UE40_9EURY|nr:hypothetical protein [Natrinema longum]MBZ6495119.1 hypothetical protein [Natrinema longum]QSW86897.1 hypothetical protein J0X27_08825 [Natrinema longum]
MAKEQQQLGFGTPVDTEDGTKIGRIRGVDEHGLSITLRDGIEGMSIEHVRSGQAFGEAELMWRCWVCGEMGRLDRAIPNTCPSCGADREDLYYWTVD